MGTRSIPAGDGFFATFSTPAAGIRCASAIVNAVRELGLDVRAGLHIGEAELTGEKVSGIAVTTAARVATAAGPGGILVTDTIVHLTAGAGFAFLDLGPRELKGVPGSWELFRCSAVDGRPMPGLLDPDDARLARNRASPSDEPRKPRRHRTVPAALAGAVVVVAIAAVLIREASDPTGSASPSPSVAKKTLVALRDESGDVAFSDDLRHALGTQFRAGPIVFTGHIGTPQAFAWVPVGVTGFALRAPKINRGSGAVVESGTTRTFDTDRTTCVCVAAAARRIWTPIATGRPSALGVVESRGITLRGMV